MTDTMQCVLYTYCQTDNLLLTFTVIFLTLVQLHTLHKAVFLKGAMLPRDFRTAPHRGSQMLLIFIMNGKDFFFLARRGFLLACTIIGETLKPESEECEFYVN